MKSSQNRADNFKVQDTSGTVSSATKHSDEQKQDPSEADSRSVDPEAPLLDTLRNSPKRRLSLDSGVDRSARRRIAHMRKRSIESRTRRTVEPATTADKEVVPPVQRVTPLGTSGERSGSTSELTQDASEDSRPPQEASTSGPEVSGISIGREVEDISSMLQSYERQTVAGTSGVTNAAPAPVKQEEVDVKGPATSSNPLALTPEQPSITLPENRAPRFHGKVSASASLPPFEPLNKVSNTNMIDLTADSHYGAVKNRSIQHVDVVFIDEHGHEQHRMPFDDCKTARQLFEEACAWEIANRETRMLETSITGCNSARISKDNEKHFEQKVLNALKGVMESRADGEDITLEVRKYM